MSSRTHERRTERATANEVAEVERQLWAFAKRIDPPGVPEAKLRPGAFLWRIHKTWHSLGRGTGGLASRSFRALRDELLNRDPPVRNLQPKLYGNTTISHAEAEQLIDVMLGSWHLERSSNTKWQARPLTHLDGTGSAGSHDLETIRENLLHTLFRGDDQLLLEESVGVPPEIFFEERGRSCKALIIPSKASTIARLSPSNAYGGFSNLVGQFFHAAAERHSKGQPLPLLIWVLRLRAIRDNSEFHQSFNALAAYSAALTNWNYRLKRTRGADRREAEEIWDIIVKHGAFVVHGLPGGSPSSEKKRHQKLSTLVDEDLEDVEPAFFLPTELPIVLKNHRLVRRHRDQGFGVAVSIEPESDESTSERLNYWLVPDRPSGDLEETADTTGLPVFNSDISPGPDYDLAYTAVYEAAGFHLGFFENEKSHVSFNTLSKMGWHILTLEQFQNKLLASTI